MHITEIVLCKKNKYSNIMLKMLNIVFNNYSLVFKLSYVPGLRTQGPSFQAKEIVVNSLLKQTGLQKQWLEHLRQETVERRHRLVTTKT